MSSTFAAASRTSPAAALPSAVLTATPKTLLLSDDRSNAIYSALVAYASRQAPAPLPTAVSLTRTVPVSLAASPAITGFLTSRLADLPKAVTIALGAWLILLALVSLVAGTRLLLVGAEAGAERGQEEKKGWLAGGVGGILFGSIVLGAVSTLLLFLIVSKQSSSSLGGWATLAIILIPGLLGAVVAGRWRWAAKLSYGFLGGVSFTLLLVASLRVASTTARLAILAVLLVLSLAAVVLPYTERYGLSFAASVTASFILVLGIDIFSHSGFVDAVGLLVAQYGVDSGGGKSESIVVQWASTGGKGLLAAWWILFLLSAAWQTSWGLGDEGDKTWNAYLSQFISAHPSTPSGTHLAPLSLKDRLFTHLPLFRRSHSPSAFTDLPRHRVRPWDERDEAASIVFDVEKGFAATESARWSRPDLSDAWDSDIETLAGFSSQRRDKTSTPSSPTVEKRVSKPAQYGTIAARFSDDEEDDAAPAPSEKDGLWTASRNSMDSPSFDRPRLEQRISSSGLSGSTAVSFRSKDLRKDAFEEVEEDAAGEADTERDVVLPLTPGTHNQTTDTDTVKSKVSSLFRLGKKTAPATYEGVGLRDVGSNAVPASPSLIRAIDRIKIAQRQARGAPLARHADHAQPKMREAQHPEDAPTGKPTVTRERRASMDEWWREVIKKSEGR